MSAIPKFNPEFSSEDLDVRMLEGNKLLLLENFSFTSKNGTVYIAKKGFVFDGASIPRYFWVLIGHPFSSKYVRSALIHDLLYGSKALSREDADSLFKEMLEVDRVSSWKVPVMYRAVRVSGASSFEKPYSYGANDSSEFLEVTKVEVQIKTGGLK